MTGTPSRGFDTGDATVDAALTGIAVTDPATAGNAEAAFGSLTWGTGLPVVSLRGVQEFLWYQLPEKWAIPLDEHLAVARSLGVLFDRVGLPRYAAVCTAPVTGSILTAYDTGGRAAGVTAYRKALAAGGVEPPEIPGVLTWGGMLGVEEHAAFWSLADHLELAITACEYTPGRRGWTETATSIARDYLTTTRLDLGGETYLQRIHTERRTRWAASRGPGREALTRAVLPLIGTVPAVPGDAEDHLAQVRWLLARCDGDGAGLTVNHTLGRALLTEAGHRFGWLILGRQAPPENQLPEAIRLRAILTELGGTRRRGRRLILTPRGRDLLHAGTAALWDRVTGTLIPAGAAEAGAAEILLMLLVTGRAPDHGSLVVADALTGEGWSTDEGPVTARAAWSLAGEVSGRLEFLNVTEKRNLSTQTRLTPTGRVAAIAALRQRAHQPRNRP